MSSIYKLFGISTLVLVVLQLLLVLVSWLVTAAATFPIIHSLLSAEGVRWFVGHLTFNLQSPVLVWIILVAIASGTIYHAWLAHSIAPSRSALHAVVVELVVFVVVLLLLSVTPHALLLSVTGSLFPSSFSDGLLPMLCFMATVCSLTYCVFTRQVRTIGEAYAILCTGLRWAVVVIPFYIVASQLFHSLLYVFFR